MRAIVLGLVGVVLAGGAQAASCRPGHISLQSADRTFFVAEVSSFASSASERLALKGALQGAMHIIDLQSAKGSSAFLTSYAGHSADAGGMPVKWSREPVKQVRAGGTIEVESGPLAGEWRVSCNE